MVALVSRTGRQHQRYNLKGCRQVVGCIPYRFDDEDQLEVLVISSQKNHKMLFPKGGWEIDESMEEAALRETLEEAGVKGEVKCNLGKWSFKSKRYDTFYEGYMFSLHVKDELESWAESHVRTRKWMTVKDAREICQYWWMKEALDVLIQRLSPSQQEDDDTVEEEDIVDVEQEEEDEDLSPTCMLS
ncbi:hypothetical protein MKW98_005653 [Papaver atlanticum]|uniref:Nudix hydrolase domain-containing protein n=1 Tax=Papaver atlanticum TaxID=357466 RepID=A0AAD4SSF4_9MAGN|nr:hypothetical protein MKW98_005653 [Papaver atlanticum]